MNKREKILIVDDTQINIDILKSMLKNQEYEFLSTTDPYKAIKIIQKENIDLILLDIVMPIIDGYEVCKLLKKNESTKSIPVIFITIKNENMEKGFEVGAVDYIAKPFKVEELLARVKTHLNLRKYQLTLEQRIKEEVEKNNKQSKLIFHQSKMLAMVEMMDNIAHQWRQPLAKINSVIFSLDKEINTLHIDKEQVDVHLSQIETYTENMSDTIEEFISFVKKGDKKELYNLSESIHNSLKIIDNIITKHNISIKLNFDNSIFLNGFKSEFQQLFLIFINHLKDTFIRSKQENREIKIILEEIDDNIFIHICNNIEEKEDYNDNNLKFFDTSTDLNIAKMIIEDSMKGILVYENTNDSNCLKIKL